MARLDRNPLVAVASATKRSAAPLCALLVISICLAPSRAQTVGRCPVFPADNIWNTPVDNLPLDPNSAAYVGSIGTAAHLHPDFGSGLWDGAPIGIPYVLVTNQPGIGIGYYSKEDFYRVNREMMKSFSKTGILVDKIYFCPHSKSEKCECRKPGLALIRRAEEDLNLDLSRSVMIGDKTSDIETGKRAGMKTILVRTGFGGRDGEFSAQPDLTADDLLDAAGHVLEMERK